MTCESGFYETKHFVHLSVDGKIKARKRIKHWTENYTSIGFDNGGGFGGSGGGFGPGRFRVGSHGHGSLGGFGNAANGTSVFQHGFIQSDAERVGF